MYEKVFVTNFIHGMEVQDEVLYVEEKLLKTARNGRAYIDVVLKDKTDKISSKIWDNVEDLDGNFQRGDFVKVKGSIETYHEKLQFRITSLKKLEKKDVDPMDFIESIPQEHINAYFSKIKQFTDNIQEPFLNKLLLSFWEDEEFVGKFKRCPAAKALHHAHIGGLVKHVSYMLLLARSIVNRYKMLNSDLLYTGIVLHDIGKVKELETDTTISYTVPGEMLGHATLGINLIREKAAQIEEFPENLIHLIEHMLLSHHGLPEYGAAKYPQFREAWMLHLIDNIDSKMEIMNSYLSKIPENEIWTQKVWSLNDVKLLNIEQFYNFPE